MFPVTQARMSRGLETAAEQYPDRDALLVGKESLTFRQLDQLSNSFACHLAAQGVVAGERVVVMTANRPEFVVAVHAISKLGAAAVLLNPVYKSLEVAHAIRITLAAYAVADASTADVLRAELGADRVLDVDDALTQEQVAVRDGSALRLTPASEDDEAVLVFSSGTTGLPKAVRHTHRSMGAATTHWRLALGLGPDDRFQVATPPSHILGLLNLLAAAEAAATVRLHRRFDLDQVLASIEADRMTLEMAVAPIAMAISNHPRLEEYDLSSLRFIMWGATPVTPQRRRARHGPHGGSLALWLRRQRAAGDRRQPHR